MWHVDLIARVTDPRATLGADSIYGWLHQGCGRDKFSGSNGDVRGAHQNCKGWRHATAALVRTTPLEGGMCTCTLIHATLVQKVAG